MQVNCGSNLKLFELKKRERKTNEKYTDYFKLTKKKRKFTNLM